MNLAQLELPKLPKLSLEPAVRDEDMDEDAGLDQDMDPVMGEAELALITDALPMLRFLMLCDMWRWRLERWSRGEGSEEGVEEDIDVGAGAAAGSSCIVVAPIVGERCLGTPLIERAALRERLRRFDFKVLETGEAIAHLFSTLTSPDMLWRYFLFRLGDHTTTKFDPKLPRYAGTSDVLDALRPPRLKADPSLVEVSLLPKHLLAHEAARKPHADASLPDVHNTSIAQGA